MAGPMQPVMQREPEPAIETEVELPSYSRLPRLDLGVEWASPWEEFRSSWSNFFDGTKAPPDSELPADSDLRVEWIEGKAPKKAFGVAVLWQFALIGLLFLPVWRFLASKPPDLELPRIELTWTNPSPDLPPISLPGVTPKPSPKGDPAKPLPEKGADAFHPRQTILSQPVRVNHPRQTLIQPDAPPTPPKIETALPNIAQWSSAPAPPRPRLESSAAAPQRQLRSASDLTAPEIANQEKTPGELNIAASPTINPQPRMPLNAMSQAAERHAAQTQNVAAPEVGSATSGDANLHRLIVISANPAPPAAEVSVPQGNLSARVAISPDGKQPGAPGGAEHAASTNGGAGGHANSSGGTGKTSTGNDAALPAAVSVTGGNRMPGGLSNPSRSATKLNLKPPPLSESRSAHSGPSVIGPIDPNLPPEKILSGKEVYTLHVNMPNLTSVSGSWIMSFAQLDEGELPYNRPKGVLSGPEPEVKVDPKYPPTLIKEKVDGNVILYAIIRKDGTVDSIQLVHGIDPVLDKNSMEALSRWVFRPGARDGKPVDLEAVIQIPFHFKKPE